VDDGEGNPSETTGGLRTRDLGFSRMIAKVLLGSSWLKPLNRITPPVSEIPKTEFAESFAITNRSEMVLESELWLR
jgi:hypothetical protein